MTREERQALRESLLAQGFERKWFSNDIDGTGEYIELWCKADTNVTIEWGERVR